MCRTNNDETRSAGIYVPDAALSNLSIADFSVMSVYVVYIFGRWFSRDSFIAELNVMSVYDKFTIALSPRSPSSPSMESLVSCWWHASPRAPVRLTRCHPPVACLCSVSRPFVASSLSSSASSPSMACPSLDSLVSSVHSNPSLFV